MPLRRFRATLACIESAPERCTAMASARWANASAWRSLPLRVYQLAMSVTLVCVSVRFSPKAARRIR